MEYIASPGRTFSLCIYSNPSTPQPLYIPFSPYNCSNKPCDSNNSTI